MKNSIQRILKYGTLVSTYALLGSVLLQIFARFFLDKTPVWTEEASRLCFIYATAFAAGLALVSKYYVHLDVFYNRFPIRAQRTISMAVHAISFLLFLVMTVYSVHFVMLGHAEFSPTMPMRMSMAFGSIFILSLSLTYFSFLGLKKSVKVFRR